MAKRKTKVPVDVYPKSIETFRKVDSWDLRNMQYRAEGPDCFNGIVSIKKYKVTVELIEEPVEVYWERLEKLWLECDNHHHWEPLKQAAKSVGYEFKGERGSQKKRKTEF